MTSDRHLNLQDDRATTTIFSYEMCHTMKTENYRTKLSAKYAEMKEYDITYNRRDGRYLEFPR